jgi:hypothetical protein
MDHNISHRQHFCPGQFRVSGPNFRWNMPRSFTDDLEVA